MALDKTQLIGLYRTMRLIRRFEERVVELVNRDEIPRVTHEYVGQEAVATGVCAALRPDDVITSTHRGHGHILAKGGDPRRMMAELMGKASGYNRGRGGSMHIADLSLGIYGANGIVGAGAPIACGAALAGELGGGERPGRLEPLPTGCRGRRWTGGTSWPSTPPPAKQWSVPERARDQRSSNAGPTASSATSRPRRPAASSTGAMKRSRAGAGAPGW